MALENKLQRWNARHRTGESKQAMTLAQKLHQWGELKRQLDSLEADIQAEVLELKQSQSVGDVVATYTIGRGSYNYEEIVRKVGASKVIIESHSKYVTDWKAVCEEIYIPPEVKAEYYTPGTPSVRLKLKG